MSSPDNESSFESELRSVINRYSQENNSDTPDFLLAAFLTSCLRAYEVTVKNRDKWFGVDMWAKDKLISTKPEEKTTA